MIPPLITMFLILLRFHVPTVMAIESFTTSNEDSDYKIYHMPVFHKSSNRAMSRMHTAIFSSTDLLAICIEAWPTSDVQNVYRLPSHLLTELYVTKYAFYVMAIRKREEV